MFQSAGRMIGLLNKVDPTEGHKTEVFQSAGRMIGLLNLIMFLTHLSAYVMSFNPPGG